MNKEELRQELEKFSTWYQSPISDNYGLFGDDNDDLINGYLSTIYPEQKPLSELGILEPFGKLINDFNNDVQDLLTNLKSK